MPTVRRTTTFSVDKAYPPEERAKRFAEWSRATRDQYIARGEAAPIFETIVDGRKGAREETIHQPGGMVVYKFSPLGEAVRFGLQAVRDQSPVGSGRYRESWFVAVNGTKFTGNPRDIPAGSQVTITNSQPYHRKITVGAQGAWISPGIVERVELTIKRKFPTVDTDVQFVTIPNGYVLKGRPRNRVRNRGSDLKKGARMTYPAIILNAKVY